MRVWIRHNYTTYCPICKSVKVEKLSGRLYIIFFLQLLFVLEVKRRRLQTTFLLSEMPLVSLTP